MAMSQKCISLCYIQALENLFSGINKVLSSLHNKWNAKSKLTEFQIPVHWKIFYVKVKTRPW